MARSRSVVHDDGPGFPAHVLEQIRPGYTTTRDGYGLSLVAVLANVQYAADVWR